MNGRGNKTSTIKERNMEFESITKTVFDEFRRIERNKRLEGEIREAFETAPEFEEIPINLKRKIDEKLFFDEGPEVTIPADKFVFSY
jgi:hypothetical protein